MTIYLNFQFFGKQNIFSLLGRAPLCMELSVIMLFVSANMAFTAKGRGQSVHVTLSTSSSSLQKVLDEMEKQSEYHFFCNNE